MNQLALRYNTSEIAFNLQIEYRNWHGERLGYSKSMQPKIYLERGTDRRSDSLKTNFLILKNRRIIPVKPRQTIDSHDLVKAYVDFNHRNYPISVRSDDGKFEGVIDILNGNDILSVGKLFTYENKYDGKNSIPTLYTFKFLASLDENTRFKLITKELKLLGKKSLVNKVLSDIEEFNTKQLEGLEKELLASPNAPVQQMLF